MLQSFLSSQRDQPLLLAVDMREWLSEDDLVFVVLDAVAALDLGGSGRRWRQSWQAAREICRSVRSQHAVGWCLSGA